MNVNCQILLEIKDLIEVNNEKTYLIKANLEKLSKNLYRIINSFNMKKDILPLRCEAYSYVLRFNFDENGYFYVDESSKTLGSNSSRILSLKEWDHLSLYDKKTLVEYFSICLKELRNKLEEIIQDLNKILANLNCME